MGKVRRHQCSRPWRWHTVPAQVRLLIFRYRAPLELEVDLVVIREAVGLEELVGLQHAHADIGDDVILTTDRHGDQLQPVLGGNRWRWFAQIAEC